MLQRCNSSGSVAWQQFEISAKIVLSYLQKHTYKVDTKFKQKTLSLAKLLDRRVEKSNSLHEIP